MINYWCHCLTHGLRVQLRSERKFETLCKIRTLTFFLSQRLGLQPIATRPSVRTCARLDTVRSLSHDFLVELAYLSSTVAPCKVTFQLVTSDFDHKAFELMHLKLSVSQRAIHLLCLYRPPPSKKNRMTGSMFFIGS